MDDIYTYRVEIQGQIHENDLNAASPLHMTAGYVDAHSTLVAVHTDQSGLVGVIRHLHGRGFLVLSVQRE